MFGQLFLHSMLHFVSYHSLTGAVLVPSDTRQHYSIVTTASGYEPETLHIVGYGGSAPRRPRYMVAHKSCAYSSCCSTSVLLLLLLMFLQVPYTLSFYPPIPPVVVLLCCAQVYSNVSHRFVVEGTRYNNSRTLCMNVCVDSR